MRFNLGLTDRPRMHGLIIRIVASVLVGLVNDGASTPIYAGVLQEDKPKSTGVKLSQGNVQIVLPRTSIVSGAPCHRPGSSANNLQIGTDLFVDFVERAIPQSGQLIQSNVHLRRFKRSVAHHSKRSVCFGQNAISGHLRC